MNKNNFSFARWTDWRQVLIVLSLVICTSVAIANTEATSGGPEHYGWLSLAPALATLTISFWTKNVLLGLLCGVLLGGAVFGDQCSPYSDTTVLSSMACGADLMDHVLTQLPLALLAAGISMVLYVLIAFISFL